MSGAKVPDFKERTERHIGRLGSEGLDRLLDEGRCFALAGVLRSGGSLLFPHATIETCGHQTAAVVHACLDCGTDRVVAIGVLHGLSDELREARARVAAGGDLSAERLRGLQGPAWNGRKDWRNEFSLISFLALWEQESRRRGGGPPQLTIVYPFLAGDRPETLPGMEDLQFLSKDAAVVGTMDPVHHGVGYGDPPDIAMSAEAGGLAMAERETLTGLRVLAAGDYMAYQAHCARTRSDGRDVGAVIRALRGPFEPEIVDFVTDDMSGPYNAPQPTWVAGGLIALNAHR